MRRRLHWIGLAAAAVLSGCSTLSGEPTPAPEPGAAAVAAAEAARARAEEQFKGRWYELDKNMSCQVDRTVTFADGKATYESFPVAGGGEGGEPAGGPPTDGSDTDLPAAAAAGSPPAVTLPYRVETDTPTGLKSLVVARPEGEDRYWIAGPDFLLALNADGYAVMAHCD